MPGPAPLQQLVRGHMPALDGLRGIAILLVLAHAFNVIQSSTGIAHLFDVGSDVGWIGVQLFFVLSGFLITGILLDTRGTPGYYRSFYVRRMLRILPLYYGTLLVAFVVLPWLVTPVAGHGDHQVWLWLFLENQAAPFGRGEPAFPHFWSLCVEEQFYLAWPLLVAIAGRRGVAATSIVLVVAAIAARLYVRHYFGEPIGPQAAYTFTPCRMDALALGALAAVLVRNDHVAHWIGARQAATLNGAGIVLLLAGLGLGHLQRTGADMQAFGYTLLAMGFASIVVGVLRLDNLPARLLALAPLRRIGRYSYGMYVFHAPIHLFIGLPLLAWLGRAPGLLMAFAYLAAASLLTFAAAAVSYHFYERRFLALKPRLAPKWST